MHELCMNPPAGGSLCLAPHKAAAGAVTQCGVLMINRGSSAGAGRLLRHRTGDVQLPLDHFLLISPPRTALPLPRLPYAGLNRDFPRWGINQIYYENTPPILPKNKKKDISLLLRPSPLSLRPYPSPFALIPSPLFLS